MLVCSVFTSKLHILTEQLPYTPELEFQLLVSQPPFLITPGFVERVCLVGGGSGRAAGQHRKGGAQQGQRAAAGMVFHLFSRTPPPAGRKSISTGHVFQL
jgi:hypothetical protein